MPNYELDLKHPLDCMLKMANKYSNWEQIIIYIIIIIIIIMFSQLISLNSITSISKKY